MANPIQRTAQLTPVAQPVDTYVAPAKSPLRDAADALGGFNANLQNLLYERQQKENDKAKAQGTAFGLTHTPEQWAEAQRSGAIPAQANRNFIAAANQAQGTLAGGQLQSKFDQAYQAWTGEDEDDPGGKKYDEFVHQFLADNLDPSQNEDFLKGALPGINQLINNGRATNTAYQSDRLTKQSLNDHVAVVAQSVRSIVQAGLKDGKGTDQSLINQATLEERTKFIASGGKPEDFDKNMMEMMSGLALETQDDSLLQWFSQKNGAGVSPDSTADGQRIKLATASQLRTLAGEKLQQENAAEERKRKADLLTAHNGIIQQIVKDPQGTVPEALLVAAEKNGDWEIRTKIKKMREDLTSGTSDPAKIQGLMSEIIENPTIDPMKIVRRGMEAGIFGTPEDLGKAVTFAQGFKDTQDKQASVKNWASYTTALKVIGDRTTPLNDLGNPISGLSDSALAARYDFQQLVARYLATNPGATDDEIEQQINKFQTSILKNVVPNPDNMGDHPAGDYNRDPNLEFANPSADGLKQQANPLGDSLTDPKQIEGESGTAPAPQTEKEATDAQPKAQGNGAPPTQEQIDKYIQQLPEKQRSQLEEGLKRKGMSLQDFTKSYLTVNPNLRPISYNPADDDTGGGDTRPNGGFSPEQAEGWISNALQGASQTGFTQETGTHANLLNLIGQGESGGNYNAVFGDGGSNIDLSQYSVDDILARQQWARQNGYPSTAIGKYGLLYKTLAGLKAEGVVDGTEQFDKATQDKLGLALLNRRGINEFLNGRISKRQFALRLSQEWASLPNPDTGKSYYAGDGLNASRMPPSRVYAALGLSPTPASYGGSGLEGDDMGLRFVHPEQRAGVKRQLTGAIAGAYADLGINDPTVLSGYRSPEHPVEAAKGNGGGEHTHGNAVDVSLKGLSDTQRSALVRSLIARGVKRFITYGRSPDMLHVDLKDQTGNGKPYFMYNKSARYLSGAPQWFQDIAFGTTTL